MVPYIGEWEKLQSYMRKQPWSLCYSKVTQVYKQIIQLCSVRVRWENVFPKGRGCEDVEFLIKSHPLDTPSNYKLSDLTLKGKRSATMAVPQGEDFIFQVEEFITPCIIMTFQSGDSQRE